MKNKFEKELTSSLREMLYCLLDEGMLKTYDNLDTLSYRILDMLRNPKYRELYEEGKEARVSRDSKILARILTRT